MILPGTPNERMGDLRTNMGLSQKELSKITGIAPSQLSRIENGEIKSISSDILIKLANAFHVSTDYILGLTTVSVPKSYDISELGLSEGAVRNLLALKADMPILNRLMEHKSFPSLARMIRSYFQDELALGVMGRNELFDLATAPLNDLRKEQPEKSADIREGVRFINSQKYGKHELDMERLKNTFLAILRDIKRDLDEGIAQEPTAVSEYLQELKEQLPEQEPPQMEDVVSAIVQMLGQTGALDEESAAGLQQLMLQIYGKMGSDQTGASSFKQVDE